MIAKTLPSGGRHARAFSHGVDEALEPNSTVLAEGGHGRCVEAPTSQHFSCITPQNDVLKAEFAHQYEHAA